MTDTSTEDIKFFKKLASCYPNLPHGVSWKKNATWSLLADSTIPIWGENRENRKLCRLICNMNPRSILDIFYPDFHLLMLVLERRHEGVFTERFLRLLNSGTCRLSFSRILRKATADLRKPWSAKPDIFPIPESEAVQIIEDDEIQNGFAPFMQQHMNISQETGRGMEKHMSDNIIHIRNEWHQYWMFLQTAEGFRIDFYEDWPLYYPLGTNHKKKERDYD